MQIVEGINNMFCNIGNRSWFRINQGIGGKARSGSKFKMRGTDTAFISILCKLVLDTINRQIIMASVIVNHRQKHPNCYQQRYEE